MLQERAHYLISITRQPLTSQTWVSISSNASRVLGEEELQLPLISRLKLATFCRRVLALLTTNRRCRSLEKIAPSNVSSLLATSAHATNFRKLTCPPNSKCIRNASNDTSTRVSHALTNLLSATFTMSLNIAVRSRETCR